MEKTIISNAKSNNNNNVWTVICKCVCVCGNQSVLEKFK